MKCHILAIAFAGLASTTHAETFSLTMAAPDLVGGLTSTFEVEVFADSTLGTHILGGAFSLQSYSPDIVSMSWEAADWSIFNTDDGYAGNGNYDQVVFGQLIIPDVFPPANGSELGSRVGTFRIEISISRSDPFIDFELIEGNPLTLDVYDSTSGLNYNDLNYDLALGSVRVYTFPSPSSISVLALSGIIAQRRRKISMT